MVAGRAAGRLHAPESRGIKLNESVRLRKNGGRRGPAEASVCGDRGFAASERETNKVFVVFVLF